MGSNPIQGRTQGFDLNLYILHQEPAYESVLALKLGFALGVNMIKISDFCISIMFTVAVPCTHYFILCQFLCSCSSPLINTVDVTCSTYLITCIVCVCGIQMTQTLVQVGMG